MDNLQDKVQKEVVINADDAKNIRDFFSHFKIEMPDGLNSALTRFESKSKVSIEDQNQLKVELCAAMCSSEHPMFRDELFSNVISNSKKICYEATFQKELEAQLSQKPESK